MTIDKIKKHPLAKVTKHITCNGTITTGTTPTIDSKGNPTYPSQPLKMEMIILLKKNQQYLRDLYSVDGARKVADVYIQKVWVNGVQSESIDLYNIQESMSSLDGQTNLSIVDRSQNNLVPITKVFGKKLTVVIDGVI